MADAGVGTRGVRGPWGESSHPLEDTPTSDFPEGPTALAPSARDRVVQDRVQVAGRLPAEGAQAGRVPDDARRLAVAHAGLVRFDGHRLAEALDEPVDDGLDRLGRAASHVVDATRLAPLEQQDRSAGLGQARRGFEALVEPRDALLIPEDQAQATRDTALAEWLGALSR